MQEYLYGSAKQVAAAIKSKNVSALELVNACIDRIEQTNPKTNAVVQLVAERARTEAIESDQLTTKGQFKGPLHGVPISIKDSLDTEGIISTGGTIGRKDFVPDIDASVVARLRQAGAILIAKTNTPELTFSAETNNLIYGRTSNPYDVDRSPGGSSGGSAAIIASGGSFLELGSDTGGSIREPAHLCGICGIKPTAGRMPRTGHIVDYSGGIMDSLTQLGPMARYVEDLSLALPIICGPDGIDPSVVPVPVHEPNNIDVFQLKIAYYTDNGVVQACDDVVRVVCETVDALQAAGLNVKHQLLPEMKNLIHLTTKLRDVGNQGLITRLLERYGTQTPGPDLQGYFSNKKFGSEYRLNPFLIEEIDKAKSKALQFMAGYDAIICPPAKEIARLHGACVNDSFDDWSYLTIYNLLGWPGVTVRAGTSQKNNLPVGAQVVTAPWREDIALALAQKIESVMGGYSPPQI